MKKIVKMSLMGAMVAGGVAMAQGARADRPGDDGPRCHTVDAVLTEDPGGAACPADHPKCFVGKVEGRGLRASALFFAEGIEHAPPQSPDYRSYSGLTTWTTRRGTLTTRDTGLFSTVVVNGDSGLSMAFAQIISGTGEFQDATGYLFATGFIADATSHETTNVSGKICVP